MGVRATITSKGQITVPKEIRDRYGLKPGDTVEFIEEGGKTWMKPRKLSVVDMFGMLGTPPAGGGSSQHEIDEAVGHAVAAHVMGDR